MAKRCIKTASGTWPNFRYMGWALTHRQFDDRIEPDFVPPDGASTCMDWYDECADLSALDRRPATLATP